MVHAFQFDSLHWHLQENNDFFWGSKRTNWFEGFLTLSQPTIICQNPWHTQQRKNKRFEQRSTCSGVHGGELAYTKEPELVLHSSWHLHWHRSAQLCSPCLRHIIFVTFSPPFVVIYGHISVAGLWFFLCHPFVGFAQRESCLWILVWCWCLFSCVLFLQFG